jgi:RNA-directed DNA polymerase
MHEEKTMGRETGKNRGGAGVDHVTIDRFEERLEENLERTSEELRDGTYRPQAIKRVMIPKPGKSEKRPLGIPTVRDRVVQTAIRNVLEPIFEKEFEERSYGFRPKRGCHDALNRVETLLKKGYIYVVDADIKSFFDTIPHDNLMERVREKVTDGRVLELIEEYLKQDILGTAKEWAPERGTPQGAVISPLLANIYLDPLDKHVAFWRYEMVRYADDFVILCESEEEARNALKLVEMWMTENGLTLHPEKTRIVDATKKGGFDLLGYHFERGYKWPSKKSEKKLKDKIRRATRRTNGNSLRAIIADVNTTLKGWYVYFRFSHQTTYTPIDSWVRMRLRSILRKRAGRKGRGRGLDHNRWPNAYFTEQGLFFLKHAFELSRQSSSR